MEAMRTAAFLLAFLLVSLTQESHSKKIKHCNKKCILLVNYARQLRTLGIDLSVPNRKLSKYCRSTKISNDQCVNIIKLSQNIQLNQAAVCLQSGVCKKDTEINRRPCPICDAIESKIEQPIKQYSRETADVKRLVSDICRTSTTQSLKTQCELLQPRLGLFGDNILRLFKPSTCRKIVCNTATKKVMGFFAKSPLACKICQTSADATTKSIQAISKVFDVVLSDVSALCHAFNNTAVSKKCDQVTKSIDTIANYVIKQLNFEDICIKLDICPGDKAQSPMFSILQSVVTAEPAETESCPVCDTFLNSNNDALEKLELIMEKISKYAADACTKTGNKNMKNKCALLQQLKSVTDMKSFRKTCRMLMCSNVANLASLIAPNVDACPICKAVQKIVSDGLKQGTVLMDTITSELSVICEDLQNKTARAECYYSFNMTLKATNYIMSKFNVANFCVVAGLCSKNMRAENSRGNWLRRAFSMKDRFMTFLSMVSPSSTKCSACDMMSGSITQMKNQLDVKVSEIKSTLDKSCQGESTVIQAKCSMLKADLERSIKKQAPFVSREVCSKYLCNNIVKRMMNRLSKDSKTCDLCHNILKATTDGIQSGLHISDTFIDDLRPMCKEIKSRKGKHGCEKSLTMYNGVYGFFVKKLDLSSACSLIGLCPKEKPSFKPLPDTSSADKCGVCTKMESLTGPQFQTFKTKLGNLKSLVSGLCSGSGKPQIGAECWGLSFLTRVVEESVASQFTKQGCRKNLCQGVLAKLPKSAKSCEICKQVVKISEVSLKSFQTMFESILQDVDETICIKLNNTAASALCEKIVGDIKTILHLIIKQLSPANFCQEAGICPSKMFAFNNARNKCDVCKTVYEVNSEEMSYQNLLSTCQRLGAQECEVIARNFKLLGAAKRFHLSSKVACQRVSLCRKTNVMRIVSKILDKVGSFGSWFTG